MLKDIKIGVIMGGTSAEREVSLNSGAAVSKALRSLGLDVVDIDAGPSISEDIRKHDVGLAFIALHGGTGEDGSMQGMFEVMEVPYTGSGVMASSIAMDKLVSKALFKLSGIDVPDYIMVDEVTDDIPMKLPVVIKPSREGSSIGVAIVTEKSQIRPALEAALAYEGPALVEKYIKGKEIQIGVLNDRALGGVEVRPSTEFYDYEAKYTAGMTEYILPPELDDALYRKAMEAGLEAHKALGCMGGSRVDLIIDDDEKIYALEVNTIPGMTETSLLPKIASLDGMDFVALVEAIAIDGLKRGKGNE